MDAKGKLFTLRTMSRDHAEIPLSLRGKDQAAVTQDHRAKIKGTVSVSAFKE